MFFDRRQRQLQLRREQLLSRSAELRLSLAQDCQQLQRPAALVDQVQVAKRWLQLHPGWSLGGMGLVLLLLKPRRSRSGKAAGLRQRLGYASRWAGRAWWGWRLWQRSGRWLRGAAG